jgi:hypothetical protein
MENIKKTWQMQLQMPKSFNHSKRNLNSFRKMLSGTLSIFLPGPEKVSNLSISGCTFRIPNARNLFSAARAIQICAF